MIWLFLLAIWTLVAAIVIGTYGLIALPVLIIGTLAFIVIVSEA